MAEKILVLVQCEYFLVLVAFAMEREVAHTTPRQCTNVDREH